MASRLKIWSYLVFFSFIPIAAIIAKMGIIITLCLTCNDTIDKANAIKMEIQTTIFSCLMPLNAM